MQYDGILFDLDGTLWDATAANTAAWQRILEKQQDIKHIPTEADQRGVMGMTSGDLMKTLFPYLSYERGQELFALCCAEENVYLYQHGGIAYPGLDTVIPRLAENYPLFIVSNCGEGYIEAFLHAHKLQKYFKDWEYYSRTGRVKAENIKLVVERNGLQAPVYVGDTVIDYEAAKGAGVPFIHAAYGFGTVPDVSYIEKLSDLPHILEK